MSTERQSPPAGLSFRIEQVLALKILKAEHLSIFVGNLQPLCAEP
jgi:hypothetical protein